MDVEHTTYALIGVLITTIALTIYLLTFPDRVESYLERQGYTNIHTEWPIIDPCPKGMDAMEFTAVTPYKQHVSGYVCCKSGYCTEMK